MSKLLEELGDMANMTAKLRQGIEKSKVECRSPMFMCWMKSLSLLSNSKPSQKMKVDSTAVDKKNGRRPQK